jgi:mRNA interferase RelE/StbE
MYQIWLKDEVKVEIRRLPGNMRQRIQRAIQGLSNEPRPYDSIAMKSPTETNLELRRPRLDRWRVIYIVDDPWSEIGILAVRKRPPYNYEDLSDLLEEFKT